jgi:hypothetical protein
VYDDKVNRTVVTSKEYLDHKDSDMPQWKGKVTIKSDTIVSPATAGFSDGLTWFHIRDTKQKTRNASNTVDWNLDGRYSKARSHSPMDNLNFSYDGICSLFTIGVTDTVDYSNLKFHGEWATDQKEPARVFWPEMTAALMAGVHSCAPDACRLSRMLAFSNDSQYPNTALVLVAELPEFAGTMEEVIKLIFRGDNLREQFLKTAIAVLERVKRAKSQRAIFNALAISAHQAMGTFDYVHDIDTANQILRDVNQNFASDGDISLR